MNGREMLEALGTPGDVREWLVRRLTPSEVRDEQARCADNAGAGTPGNIWTTRATAFARRLDALVYGEEVWEFRSPPETWTALRGRGGLCVLRRDEACAIHVSMLS